MNHQIDLINRLSQILLDLVPQIYAVCQSHSFEVNQLRSGDQDITANLDLEIDKLVQNQIKNQFPQIIIDSEEAPTDETGEWVLRLDPVDGSKHAHVGIKTIVFEAVLLHDNQPVFSLIFDPFANLCFYATKGQGAFVNQKAIVVNQSGIEDSFVLLEQPHKLIYESDPQTYNLHMMYLTQLGKSVFRFRNFGLWGLSACLVAQGSGCAFVDISGTTKLYDMQGACLIAQEAGAKIGYLGGEELTDLNLPSTDLKKHIKKPLVIANPKAYLQIQTIINQS